MLPPCMFQMSSNLPEDTALLQRRQLAWRRSTVGWRQKQQLCEELRAGLNGPWVKGSHILKLRIWTPCQVLPLRFHALTFVLLGGVTTFTASTENIQTGLPPLLLGRGFTQTRIYTTLDWTGMSLPPPNLTPCLPECLLGMASQTAWFWKLDSDEDWEPVHRWKRRTCRFLQPLLKDNMKAC